MDKIIFCKNCGKPVDIDEAMRHQVEDKIRKEEAEKAKLNAEKDKVFAVAQKEKEIREQTNAELEKNKKEKIELEEKLKISEEEGKKREEKIREDAEKSTSAKYHLEKMAWEKTKSDLEKKLDEAQRTAKQGSQQLQGDVLEIDLEIRLRESFPNDEFKSVATGVKGGDLIHVVKNKFGNEAGTILWEAKRQKAWSKGWLTKLKEDMREIKASDCILVTDKLPENIKIYDRVENAWITSYEYVIKLASVIRYGLLNVAIARSGASHSDEQLRELYRIITSDSFRQMFEARDEIIGAMRIELTADKRSAEKRWKKQESHIDKLDRNNSRIYGELQSYIPSLKPLKEVDILQIEAIGDEKFD